MKFDIPINVSVLANNETQAERRVLVFLVKAIKEFGVEHSVTDFEYFEFIAEQYSRSGCGDNHHE